MTVPMKPVDYLHPLEKLKAVENWLSDVIKNGNYKKDVDSLLKQMVDMNNGNCEFCKGSGIAIDMPCSRCKGLGGIGE